MITKQKMKILSSCQKSNSFERRHLYKLTIPIILLYNSLFVKFIILILLISLFSLPMIGQGIVLRPINGNSPQQTYITITDNYIKTHLNPSNFDIALKKDQIRFYVTSDEYKRITNKNSFEVEGIVIIEGNLRFIIEPKDKTEEYLNWYEAMDRYSSVMPSKEEAELWHKYKKDINVGLKAINGKLLDWYQDEDSSFYWTKTETDYYGRIKEAAWYTCFDGNNSLNKDLKKTMVTSTDGKEREEKNKKVRAVIRF